MLRLSKKADYGLMAMVYVAAQPGARSASAREIAAHHEIPVELLAKILQCLVRRGLLVSQHGMRGGYHLARAATGISVADVVQAVDGPFRLTACSEDDEPCDQRAHCNVRDPLARIKHRILEVLGGYTIAEIVQDGKTDPQLLVLKAADGRTLPVRPVTADVC